MQCKTIMFDCLTICACACRAALLQILADVLHPCLCATSPVSHVPAILNRTVTPMSRQTVVLLVRPALLLAVPLRCYNVDGCYCLWSKLWSDRLPCNAVFRRFFGSCCRVVSWLGLINSPTSPYCLCRPWVPLTPAIAPCVLLDASAVRREQSSPSLLHSRAIQVVLRTTCPCLLAPVLVLLTFAVAVTLCAVPEFGPLARRTPRPFRIPG